MSVWECDLSKLKKRLAGLLGEGVTNFAAYFSAHPTFIREAMELTLAVDANRASLRMFGAASKEDLLGSISRYWPEESEAVFADSMVAALDGQHEFSAEVTLRTLAGAPIQTMFSVGFRPAIASGRPGFVTFADVTARNRMQASLRKAQSNLAHADRLTTLGELTASIAHEVKQPLSSIVSNGQAGLRWLRRPAPDIDHAVSSLEALVVEAHRASSIIENIRAIAKKEDARSEPIDLVRIIRETITLLGHELSLKNMNIFHESNARHLHVLGDPIQIQQVFVNLIMNAVKELEAISDRRRSIRIISSVEGDQAIVSVVDNGPGVDASAGDIFAAFTTSRPDGIGLGLSICATIVGQHSGRIWTENDPQGGANFSFSLPLLSDPDWRSAADRLGQAPGVGTDGIG